MTCFRAIAEHEEQLRVWMMSRVKKKIWGSQSSEVEREPARLAEVISQFAPVTLIVDPNDEGSEEAVASDGGTRFDVVRIPFDDLWIRDSGPVFVRDEAGKVNAVRTNFNGWGHKQECSFDAEVAEKLANEINIHCVESWLVTEGGALEFDGQNTAIVTESSVVNNNRNPGKSKHEIEIEMLRVVGVEKVVWLKGHVDENERDITDGHVDYYARFVRPGLVVVHLEAYKKCADFKLTRDIRQILEHSQDAQGRQLEVVTIDGPLKVKSNDKDFAASYLNFLALDKAVIAPKFGDRNADQQAKRRLSELYPGREIVQVSIDAIAAGGGGIHCATLNTPI